MKQIILSYQGTKQKEYLITSTEDMNQLAEIDKDEVDVFFRINWITPKNLVNQNEFEYAING